ncbi:hypothetical protein [Porticoccus sp.]
MKSTLRTLLFSGAMLTVLSVTAEPPLPGGLEPSVPTKQAPRSSGPALPSGLGLPGSAAPEPSLPSGLGDDTSFINTEKSYSPFSVYGFAEARVGQRTHDDEHQRNTFIGEGRAQLTLDYAGETVTARVTGDVLFDDVQRDESVQLDRGRGPFDLREAWFQMPVNQHLDVKAGRQILTWGVGDLLFINDLFPKDWNSFFSGRDTEYLKAPSDAVKLAFYFEPANLDVVYVPEFDSDRFIDGRRISFYNPLIGDHTGRDMPVNPDFPHGRELALRLYKNLAGAEVAFYGYDGYWKSPNGFDPFKGQNTFPELRVWGASLRGNLGKGIASGEVGYYDSRDDRNGDNPLINNSESRLLLAYEQELVPSLTGALQYYVERLEDYDNYRDSLPAGMPQRDKYRQLLTNRLTWLTHNQNVTWSLFVYYSPTDKDWYARPKVSWKASDQLLLETGFNSFGGSEETTFFGQFEEASSFYAAIRYSF